MSSTPACTVPDTCDRSGTSDTGARQAATPADATRWAHADQDQATRPSAPPVVCHHLGGTRSHRAAAAVHGEEDPMRACVMRQGQLVIDDVPDPRPETGQVVVRILSCGICGSDLHFLRHGDAMVAMTDDMLPSMGAANMGMAPIDTSRDIIMGHEFCGEVVELGPDTS